MAPSNFPPQRAIFERAQIGVVEVDLDGRMTYANPTGMDLLGLSSFRDVALQTLFVDPSVFDQQLSDRKAGLIGSYRTHVRRADDNEKLSLQVTAIPYRDKHG